MLAPVYRSLESRSTVVGLAFPGEFTIVLCAWWAGMLFLGAFSGLAVAVGTYVIVRVVNYGRADGFVQHFLQWTLRRALYAGRLSGAARASPTRSRALPHAVHAPTSEEFARQLAAFLADRRDR